MTTFPNRRRLAGAESQRLLAIAKPFIEYLIAKYKFEGDSKNRTGIQFKSTATFQAKELDEILIKEEKSIEEKKQTEIELEIKYQEKLVQELPKIAGRKILFTSALSIMETPPETERFASTIAEDYFSNNFRASREYIQIITKLANKDTRVLDSVLIPISPLIFPATFEKNKMKHALPEAVQYANENCSTVYRFGTLEKSLDTLDQPTKRNYAFNPSYFHCYEKFENKSDPFHYFKEKHRTINRTIMAYMYAAVLDILKIDVVRSYLQLNSYENEILTKAAKLIDKQYIPVKAMKNAKPAIIGICEEAALRQFEKTIKGFYENEPRQLSLI